MKQAIPYIGGLGVGLLLGILIGSYTEVALLIGRNAVTYMLASTVLGAIAGVFLGWKVSGGVAKPVRPEGRLWQFPQGVLFVQVALKRMGSVVGEK